MMIASNPRCLVISDFNIENLAGHLRNDTESPALNVDVAPYGQIVSVLMGEDSQCWQNAPDYVVVWTQPQSVISSFNRVLEFQQVSMNQIIAEVDQYCAWLNNLCHRVKYIFVPTWVLPSYNRGFGMLDMEPGLGIANILMQMNLRLAEKLYRDGQKQFCVLDAQKWVTQAGEKKAFNPKLWYMGKIAFGNEVFAAAAKDIKAAVSGVLGQARKLIVLDLDNTIWGGIVGDVGWQGLQLGGHDPLGESYVDFQKGLKSLTKRGVMLAIASKNEEDVAIEAIKRHPEMVLRPDDFVGWRINWQDKAQNIIDLVSSLNLGLQSVVFIDDNPVERARVQEMLPEVLVPDWPEDKTCYTKTLLNMRCFDSPVISQEDLDRTRMYLTSQKREESKKQVGSYAEWLKNLETIVEISELSANDSNFSRAVQLLNKTNQMNLATRRMTESEYATWLSQKNRIVWSVRVSDKFGNSGLTGVVSLEIENQTATIADFVLSCRVMGRKIEEAMLGEVVRCAQELGLTQVCARCLPTAKNKPCQDFWQQSGFECSEKNMFRWDTGKSYPLSNVVTVKKCACV